ncbi:MAG: CRISPR-associated endonuclease Cas1 [Desulfobacterales bacterium RIFOXYA12_FULL_46_15]|nr:MAG: CRISPR-associated endonuclease Cas1 [Desulfobacterales bacterium RIFOXYA12_FULL_46_15]
MIVYIKTQGARIIKEERHLQVKKGNDVYNTLFTYKLDQLLLFGNIEITHGALCMLMKSNIDTIFLTRYGRYLGRLASPESKNVFLHKRQYQMVDDQNFGLKLVKNIVSGKLTNMTTLMMRMKRSRNIPEAGHKARQIQHLISGVHDADAIDSVRGYEGRGSAIYFSGFHLGFTEPTTFTKRVRRPPTDPVNSVLSLLYTFLMNRVYSAVRIAGLDPYPGFLHTLDYGRYSLVLDLMEEFRSIIVDTLVLSLFNLKILQPSDFRTEAPMVAGTPMQVPDECIPDVNADPMGMMTMGDGDMGNFDLPEQRIDTSSVTAEPATGKYPVRLNPDAFERVIAAFEKKLTASFYYPPAEKNITYGDAIIYQAAHYRKVIEGVADVYQPLTLK